MTYKLSLQKRFAYRSFTACLGGLFLGSVSISTAYAEEQPIEVSQPQSSQVRPTQTPTNRTLRDLLLTVPTRSVASPEQPADSSAEPSAETDEAVNDQAIRLLLKLGERQVYVYRGETVEAVYPVAVGRAGWETPTGEFSVLHQVVDPGWTNPLTDEVMPPGEDNPLGDRWIAFWTDDTNVIGFHGTPNRESVGRAASHGCIRMYNEDVRQLYDIVSIGTPVTVEP